jgi:hypothetical protein
MPRPKTDPQRFEDMLKYFATPSSLCLPDLRRSVPREYPRSAPNGRLAPAWRHYPLPARQTGTLPAASSRNHIGTGRFCSVKNLTLVASDLKGPQRVYVPWGTVLRVGDVHPE